MDFNATIDLIIKDLDEARNIIDDLKKYPGVPELQIEFVKAKCKSASDVIALLKGLKDNVPAETGTVAKPEQQEQPQLSEEKNEAAAPDSTKSSVKEDKQEIAVADDKNADKESEKGSESTIFADTFSHLSGSFNEQLGSRKNEDDISEILKSKPLSNLPDAIGVNDEFLFIREIFAGDKEAYIKAIYQLDKSENLKEAKEIIMSHTSGNVDEKAFSQLVDLVKRKLLSNE